MTRGEGRAAVVASGPRQLTLVEHLEGLAQRAGVIDPRRPGLGLFAVPLALMTIGLLIQVSHASTTSAGLAGWNAAVREQALFRVTGLAFLIGAYRLGPRRLRPLLPALTVLAGVMLIAVFLPVIGQKLNGSSRWIRMPGFTVQPSELARVIVVLWIADRCNRLGDRVRDMRRGVLPMLILGLAYFGLILIETDLGGALLFLICVLCTMWVGGARPTHVAGSLLTVGGAAVALALTSLSYVRGRLAMWMGDRQNDQVSQTLEAMSSGGLWGRGFTHGLQRNVGVPYLESDYVFAQVGEELGLFGMLLVLSLLAAFVFFAARLVLALRDRYGALSAFGLLLAVAMQGMLHVQVVTGLAPPKGMPLPFVSDGGTALLTSALAVGLALGAARDQSAESATAY